MSATMDDIPNRIIHKIYGEFINERFDWKTESNYLKKMEIALYLAMSMMTNCVNGGYYSDIPYKYVWYYKMPFERKNLTVRYYET